MSTREQVREKLEAARRGDVLLLVLLGQENVTGAFQAFEDDQVRLTGGQRVDLATIAEVGAVVRHTVTLSA